MKAIFSHVSLDWREMEKADCKVKSDREENWDEKASKGLFSTFSTSYKRQKRVTLLHTSHRIALKIGKLGNIHL